MNAMKTKGGIVDKELAEAGVITIFSQFGEVEAMKLVRDKDSGESRGFGFLKYEDERSTILAIDNLNGCDISGRTLRVDHADYLPPKKSRDEIALDLRNIMKGIFPRVRTAKEICEGLEDVSTARVDQTLKRKRHSIPDVTIDRRKQRQSKQRKRKKGKKKKKKSKKEKEKEKGKKMDGREKPVHAEIDSDSSSAEASVEDRLLAKARAYLARENEIK